MKSKHLNISERLEQVIPGGCHTYSKGRDQFPAGAPQAIVRGEKAYAWDSEGDRYLDWGMGLTSVSIGHGETEVVKAVHEAAAKGVSYTLPSILELEAAEFFLETFGGDLVKFAKHGSSVTTAAVKLSRAYTGRHKVAVPKEHPFFSFDDWFITSTAADWGIPEELKKFTIQFSYNDISSLEAVFAENAEDVACVIMEPVKFDEPRPGFLESVRDLCTRHGAVLIFDEMITGLKWSVPGAGKYFGVEPDLSTWGKGIANGFSCAALSGKKDIMRLGGIDEENRRKLFLLSTTHGAESVGLAAMMKTVSLFQENDYVTRNWETGRQLTSALNSVFAERGLEDYLQVVGYPCLPILKVLGPDMSDDLVYRTLFLQEVIKCGILFQSMFVVTPSHGEKEIEDTVKAFKSATEVFARALEKRSADDILDGPAIRPVFRRFV